MHETTPCHQPCSSATRIDKEEDAQQKQRAFLEEQLADRRTERRAETRRETTPAVEREELGLDADDAADLLDARDRRAR